MKTFEDIVSGRIRCHRVWEDAHHLAFLSAQPIARGHTIVVTKRVVPYVFDLDEREHAALWSATRTVARMLKHALSCERVCTAVIGWEVRHVHVHLVPTSRAGEFPPLPGRAASESELGEVLARIADRATAP